MPLEGTYNNVVKLVSDSAIGSLTTAAFAGAPGTGIDYEINFYFSFAQYNAAIGEAVRRARGKHFLPYYWTTLTIVEDTYDYAIPPRHELAVTASGNGTTTTLVASALTQANDYWNGARLVQLTGDDPGAYATVTDYVLSTTTLTFDPPFSGTTDTNNTFTLIRFLPQYLYFIEYDTDDSVIPTPLNQRDWNIIYSPAPTLRFAHGSLPPLGATVRVYGYRAPEPPTNDMHPVEVPEGYGLNLAYWQLLRSQPRRPEFKLNNDLQNKQDAWDKAQIDLSRERTMRLAWAKKV
jgi:hypothetical protein